MAEPSIIHKGRPRPGAARASKRSPGTYVLRVLVIAYLFFLVAWPVYLVGRNAFARGLTDLGAILSDPYTVYSLELTLWIAVASVAINTVFGVGISLLIVRFRFVGRRVLNALLDLPLSVSPVVVGLALVLVYGGRTGWFGPTVQRWGLTVIYDVPGMILATTFVSLPLVIREVIPVLQEVGDEQEQAARTIGANGLQTFFRVTLPAIRWGVSYGVVLCLARSLGEFGAVKVVSGNIYGETRTATLTVENEYLNFDKGGAYATAFLLTLVAVAALLVASLARNAPSRARSAPSRGRDVTEQPRQPEERR
ncbi:MAG TPA: sulfate ABC transporter permease subunit [Nocardioidaceae bacterium]